MGGAGDHSQGLRGSRLRHKMPGFRRGRGAPRKRGSDEVFPLSLPPVKEGSGERGPQEAALGHERRQRKQQLDQGHDVIRCPCRPPPTLLPQPWVPAGGRHLTAGAPMKGGHPGMGREPQPVSLGALTGRCGAGFAKRQGRHHTMTLRSPPTPCADQ